MRKPLTPEKTLQKFLECWKSQRWVIMPRYCQKTWVSNNPTPSTFLMNVFGVSNLNSWEIFETIKIGDACVDINVQVDFSVNGIGRIKKEKIRLICERVPYRANVKGNWGVNPISAFKLLGN